MDLIGAIVNYQTFKDVCYEAGAEYVFFPFQDYMYMKKEVEEYGFITYDHQSISKEQYESLQQETKGYLDKITYMQGGSEGYRLELEFESGQLAHVKLLDRALVQPIIDYLIGLRQSQRSA